MCYRPHTDVRPPRTSLVAAIWLHVPSGSPPRAPGPAGQPCRSGLAGSPVLTPLAVALTMASCVLPTLACCLLLLAADMARGADAGHLVRCFHIGLPHLVSLCL